MDWLSSLTQTDSPLRITVLVLLPVLGFVLIAIGARAMYERAKLQSAPQDRRVFTSRVSLPAGDLEKLATDYYRSQGYTILRDGVPGEQSKEMMVVKGGQRTLIRCEVSEALPGPELIETLARTRDAHKAQRAVLLAPAGFTSEVRQRAVALGVELRDSTQIDVMRRVTEGRGESLTEIGRPLS
ncbi:MAG: restriction endonuclease [Anaerolineales bacterium]